MNSTRLAQVFGITVLVGLLLVGCSGSGESYSILDRSPEASDNLPQDVLGDGALFDEDGARFVGEHESTKFWLVPVADGDGVCLVVYPVDGDRMAGCGAMTGLTLSGPTSEYSVVPDGLDGPSGSTKISENVFLTSN